MGKKAWEINSDIKIILNRNYINITKLMINFVKDTAFIKGDLEFQTPLIDASSDPMVVNQLKKIEREVHDIKEIKHVTWELTAWFKIKNIWRRRDLKKSS